MARWPWVADLLFRERHLQMQKNGRVENACLKTVIWNLVNGGVFIFEKNSWEI